jgi:TPR repeat protein
MTAAGAAGAAEQTDDHGAVTDWLRSVAEGGTTEGQIILLDQAMQGYSEAQYSLATIYRGGIGVARDMNRARAWYRAAAAQGHRAALESLRFLAGEGDSAAYYALGLLNRDGLGVPRDSRKARQAFRWAGENGHILALFAAADMDADEAAALAGYGRVSRLAQSALDLETGGGSRAAAQYWIARLYLSGAGGLEQDAVAAARWLKGAAISGLDVAQYELARLYLDGRGVPRDRGRALAWLEAAAASGMSRAEQEIARIGEQQ